MRNKIWLAIAFSAALLLSACGESGNNAAPGFVIPAGSTSAITTAQEACMACHGVNTPLDVTVDAATVTPVHATAAAPTAAVDSAIESVAYDSGTGFVTVTARVWDTVAGTPPASFTYSDVRFTLARLVPGSGGGTNENWQPYFTTVDSNGVVTGTYDRPGDWNRINFSYTAGTGVIVYTLSRDPAVLTSTPTTRPDAPFNYSAILDFNKKHRIGMQVTNGVSNGWLDFTPDGTTQTGSTNLADATAGIATAAGPTNSIETAVGTPSRNIVETAACNECHQALALHGGTRRNVEYCVTCHNPSSFDPATFSATDSTALRTVDFKFMIHKIHRGKDLPSVQSGAKYTVASNDYSTGGFPQDIGNCNKCHTGADGNHWNTTPSREACSTCHDRTYWSASAPTTGTGWVKHATGSTTFPNGSTQTNDSSCANCHPSTGAAGSGFAIQAAHPWAQQVAAQTHYLYTITSAAFSSTTNQVTVAFTIVDRGTGDLSTGAWRKTGGASRLGLDIGWKAAGMLDYTSDGAAGTTDAPGTPKSYDMLCPLTTGGATCGTGGAAGAPVGYTLTANGGGTYTAVVDMPTAGQTARTGVAVLEGHPAEVIDGAEGNTQNIRIPVYSVYKEFKVSGSSSQASEPRRVNVVDATKCQQCHGDPAGSMLSLHGENRNINPAGPSGIALCTVCHNSANTDIGFRPTDLTKTDDNKKEQAIDFKYMIHSIHAGRSTTAGYFEIFGFGSSKNKFAGEFPPGRTLADCSNCHTGSSYTLPLTAGMQGTTISSGTSRADHTDDLNISPNTAVCSACHDGSGALTHMQVMGGNLSVKEADIEFY